MRAGKYDEALTQLERAIQTESDDNSSLGYTHYFLSMTRHAQGDQTETQTQLRKANEIAESELSGDTSWNRRLTFELLRKESESLVTPSEDDPDVEPTE